MKKNNEETEIVLDEDDKKVLSLWSVTDVEYDKNLSRRNRRFRLQTIQNKINSFVKNHLFVDYFFRRIFFGLISLFVVISVLFLIFRSVTPDKTYLNGLFYDTGTVKPGTELYNNLLNSRLKQFGLDGTLWHQLWTFWDQILPFHKKAILTHPSTQLLPDGSLTGFEVTYRWIYYGEALTTSVGDKQSQVTEIIGNGIGISVTFAVIALIFVYAIGIPTGFAIARRKGRRSDRVIGGLSTLIQATPPVILMLVVFYTSTVIFHWHTTYTSGNVTARIAPIIVIVIFQLPYIINTTRDLASDELDKTYTKFSRSVGKAETSIYVIHIMRSITISLLRTIPVAFMTTFFGISLLTETYWLIPGISKLIISAVVNNEVFVARAYIILMVSCLSGVSIIFDILAASLNSEFRK